MAQIYTSLIPLFLQKGTSLRIKDLVILKAILWLIPVLLCFKEVQAQSYTADVRKLSVEDGLSNRFVKAIYRDSQGLVWIGTNYGLNRYDGYTFKHYTTENSALISNGIRGIHEDEARRLWILQQGNPSEGEKSEIAILDLQTDNLQSFDQVFKNNDSLDFKRVIHLYSNARKEIWIHTQKGVYRYRDNRFKLMYSISEQETIDIVYADDQFLWLGAEKAYSSERKMLKINPQGEVVETFDLKGNGFLIGVDKNNTIWFFNPLQEKLLKLKMETHELQSLPLPQGFRISEYSNSYLPGGFYINPANGLLWNYQAEENAFFVYDPREGVLLDLYSEMERLFTYDAPAVKCIYSDTGDRTWVATEDGVFIITLKKNKFTMLLSGKSPASSVRGMVTDHQRRLYVNWPYSGKMLINPKTNTTKKIGEGRWATVRDNQGKLWFSGGSGVVEKYDPLTRQNQYYIYPEGAPEVPPNFQTLIFDSKERIVLGSNSGLYFLDPDTGVFQKFKQYNAFSGLEKSRIYQLHEDKQGLWIAADSGLYLLEPGKGITRRYATDEKAPRYIPHDHLLHFYRDKAGVFWLASRGRGLIRFNPEDGSYRQFTTADGLSSNIVYAVYEDDYGKLWLPSNYGLMQFDKKSYEVNTWLKDDGIAHNEFNTTSHYRGDDGRLYFGGLDGITVVNPQNFITNAVTPFPLRLTACQVLDGKTGALRDKTEAVRTSEALQLSPSDRSFIVDFALLNYENSRQNSYFYKIEGLDKRWNTSTGNSLRINDLPYGSYTLRIKGQGIKGVVSANELAISITVNKPFYLKTGFILSAMFALALLIYGMFRWRLQNLRKAKIHLQETVKQRTREIQQQKDKIETDKDIIAQQAETLQELNATQSRWFINIAHELRTPLTLILGPIRQFLKKHPDTFREDTRDIQLAGKNANSLLKLVNEILDVSRLDSKRLKLNKAPVPLSRLIREAAAHFESFAQQKGITLASHIPHDLEMNIDKERIRNILVNLISNALKFTHTGGKVTISLQHEGEEGIAITVADTGDGIPEKDLPHIFERYFQVSEPGRVHLGGAGIGLSLSLELAQLHGGDLTAESQVGKGSIFTLTLPQSLVLQAKKPAAIPVTATLPELPEDPVVPASDDKQNKPLILLVEDNPDMRQYIRSFMEERYRVAEATDGLEALDYLKKATPELIISDIMMPRMDGITLAKTLKADQTGKHLPFITLTARTGEADKIAALRIGIDDYLTKPFNSEELEARAANLIRNYTVRRALLHTDPGEITTPAYRDTRIKALRETVLKHLHLNTFTANDLAVSANMSLDSLRRFLKKHTGLSTGRFIREIRLQQARKLLEARQYPTVLEVAYEVGFEKVTYFSKLFAERFGKKPSEYL